MRGNFDPPFVPRAAVALHHYTLPFERQVISVFQNFDETSGTNPVAKVPAPKREEGEILFEVRIILDDLEGMVSDDQRLVPRAEPERRVVRHSEVEAQASGF